MLNLQGALSYHKMMMSLRSDAGPGGGWTSPSCNVFVEPKISCSFFVFADVCTFSDAPPYKNASYIRRKSSQIRSRMKKEYWKIKKHIRASVSVCVFYSWRWTCLSVYMLICSAHSQLLCMSHKIILLYLILALWTAHPSGQLSSDWLLLT